MTAFRTKDFEVLLARREGPCVSLFMPTHRAGRDIQQDPIRFKNLLRKAEEDLRSVAVRGTRVESMLEPAQALLGEPVFWDHASDGLAVFLAPGFSRTYRLPTSFREHAVVAGAFHVKPLLPLLSGDGQFTILALSQNHVRLLQGTRFSVGELEPEGMPRSLTDALRTVETRAPAEREDTSGGRRTGRYPGHGVASEAEKSDLLRFFRRVDDELSDFLSAQRAPLVLAGVERYFPLYREASRYGNLVDEGIKGNPDELKAEELHRRAWAIVEPLFRREQEEADARFKSGAAKTADDLEEVVRAAHHGRIECLFVAQGEERWGAFIPDGEGTVIHHDRYETGDQDLLDIAAAETLRHRGQVYAVPPETVPAPDSPVAAMLRY